MLNEGLILFLIIELDRIMPVNVSLCEFTDKVLDIKVNNYTTGSQYIITLRFPLSRLSKIVNYFKIFDLKK